MDTRTGLPVVGMVGGGQLARMTHQAAIALGQSLRVLASAPDDGAALVAADVHIGHPDDLDALRTFAKGCEVVTFDHEHVPQSHLQALVADGVNIAPGAAALRYAQDKRAMRERLNELGVPVPRWAGAGSARVAGDRTLAGAGSARVAGDEAAVRRLAGEVGWPVVVKAVRGGYDGRGVWVVGETDELPPTELIVEERVPLRRELCALVARSPFGQVAAYPVVETVQRGGICVEVLSPAPNLGEELAVRAEELAIRLAIELDVVGLLAVELFDTGAGLLVNELAMRPHNSGHWTIEGARTSQFEQHLRAVLDYPLGDTAPTAPAVVMANLLGGASGGMSIDERLHHLFAADPAIKVHLYGKQPRPGRKVGHVTALGQDLAQTRARARRAARWLRDATWEEPA
jgi:5-(carboxyamino)imidazole ribonucleotide synthase